MFGFIRTKGQQRIRVTNDFKDKIEILTKQFVKMQVDQMIEAVPETEKAETDLYGIIWAVVNMTAVKEANKICKEFGLGKMLK